jgi:hypothetical protein
LFGSFSFFPALLLLFVRAGVYSYARPLNQTGWTLITNLTGSGTAPAWFGGSVSLSADGTTLAVGEYGADSVWIYKATPIGSGNWTVQRKIAQTDAGFAGSVGFGSAVALSASGDTLVVGAFGYSSKGAAVVFSRNSTGGWTVQSPILADGSAGGQFGITVSINGAGNRIAVGARYDTVQGSYNGAVYIYSRNDTALSWSHRQRVLPYDSVSASNRYFGFSVSLSSSGDTLVIGAPGEGAAGMVTGVWWHFEWNGTLFEQSALKKVGQPTINGASQGSSIVLSSDGQTVIGSCSFASVGLQFVVCACLCIFLMFPSCCLCAWFLQWVRTTSAMPMCGHATCPIRLIGNSSASSPMRMQAIGSVHQWR